MFAPLASFLHNTEFSMVHLYRTNPQFRQLCKNTCINVLKHDTMRKTDVCDLWHHRHADHTMNAYRMVAPYVAKDIKRTEYILREHFPYECVELILSFIDFYSAGRKKLFCRI